MVAGLNCRINVIRFTFGADDAVGGAQPSGTTIYYNVAARISANADQQLLLQQGLETQKTFAVTVIPGTLTIYERDEIEVSAPIDHYYYNQRFRVVGVRIADFNPRDPRNYLTLQVVRSVRAHSQQ